VARTFAEVLLGDAFNDHSRQTNAWNLNDPEWAPLWRSGQRRRCFRFPFGQLAANGRKVALWSHDTGSGGDLRE
jgi:hypothetical protein